MCFCMASRRASSELACGAPVGLSPATGAGVAGAGAAEWASCLEESASSICRFSWPFNRTTVDDVKKPDLLAISWYWPGFRFAATNAPFSPLTTVQSLLSLWLWIVT